MVVEKMRAVQMNSFGSSPEVVERDRPEVTGEQVLVRVKGAGVCHSDIHFQDGYYDLGGGEQLSFKARIQFPRTLGHETAGEVVELGGGAVGPRVGQNVLVCPWVGCQDCLFCRGGEEHLCLTPQFLGVNQDGGYADYIVVPEPRYLVDLGSLDPVRAAPLACSGLTTYTAISRFGERLRDQRLVVIGAGGLGLMAVSLMAAMDLAPPVVIELDSAKREAALSAGAVAALDPTSSTIDVDIREAVGGPVLAVLDLVGSPQTFDLACRVVEKGGRIVIVGLFGGRTELQVPLIPLRSITIEGNYIGSPSELHRLIELLRQSGLPDVPVHPRALEDASSAMDELRSGSVVGRIVLVP